MKNFTDTGLAWLGIETPGHVFEPAVPARGAWRGSGSAPAAPAGRSTGQRPADTWRCRSTSPRLVWPTANARTPTGETPAKQRSNMRLSPNAYHTMVLINAFHFLCSYGWFITEEFAMLKIGLSLLTLSHPSSKSTLSQPSWGEMFKWGSENW